MELYDPQMSFKQRSYTFNSGYCISECLKHRRPVIVISPGIKAVIASPIKKYEDIAEISIYAFIKITENKENQVVAIWPEDFERLQREEDQNPGFTADVATIRLEDYAKFYSKLKKTPLT